MPRHVDKPDIANVEITPEMIARGVAFMENSGAASLTSSVYEPSFVEDFLRFAIYGGSSLKDRANS